MKENKKSLNEQIKDAKAKLISNSKDAKWSEDTLNLLLALHKRSLHTPVELTIPVSEVQDTVDFGAYSIKKTIRGYLFQCKQGFSTFVGFEMAGLCDILQSAMEYGNNKDRDEFEQYFIDCIAFVMQAPIFAAMGMSLEHYGHKQDIDPLLNIGLSIIQEYKRFTDKYIVNAKEQPETEEDVKENISFEKTMQALDNITQDN